MTLNPESMEGRPWSAEDLVEYRQLYLLRAHLEGFSARHAAVRVGEGASSECLVARHTEMRAAAGRGDHDAFVQADMALHRAVAEIARIPMLVEMWDLLAQRMHGFVMWAHRHVFHDLEGIALSHHTLIDAIRGGRARDAERIAQDSLYALWQMLDDPSLLPAGDGDAVERVCIYILLNLDQPLTLARLSREVARLSPAHLARLFRRTRGESFRAYLQGARLRRAAALLQETDVPVQTIADRVGYPDPSRFAAHFQRRFGCVPTIWRERTRARLSER